MNSKEHRQLARELIDKEKWWDMLSRFIDVLRINIFVIDDNGLVILPPEEGRYGGRLLTDQSLKFDLMDDSIKMDRQFEQHGAFLESCNRFGLSCFAIPIKIEGGQIIAYVIIGPVILNKRLSSFEYEKMAEEHKSDRSDLLNELGGIRVVSNVMINSILDLLSEIVRDNIELSIKKKESLKTRPDEGALPEDFKETVQEIYTTVYFDGLLATLLDISLKMTGAECGSIMIKDAQQEDLTMKVSRGLSLDKGQVVKVKLGEGIAGTAAKENAVFVMRGTDGDSRIKHFLKRPDIKEALVMPLRNKERVFGVLNLHSKKGGEEIERNLHNLQYLSELLSSAL